MAVSYSSGTQTPPDKTILIVEDNIDLGFCLAQSLKEETSFRVLFATDGTQALKMIHLMHPQLVLLDYLLPGSNGLYVLEQMRATKGLENIPVILMSANLPAQLPAQKHLYPVPKPFELDMLIQRIQQLLKD
jgi:CheY-like chemotaxis protein